MPKLDDLQRMTAEDENLRAVYWCKDKYGGLTERITTAYEGHRGHVQCIPVAVADQAASGSYAEPT